jgi:hypothetical protein
MWDAATGRSSATLGAISHTKKIFKRTDSVRMASQLVTGFGGDGTSAPAVGWC